jgi:hypothetical protein
VKLSIDNLTKTIILVPMADKKSIPYDQLAEMSFDEILEIWRRLRLEHFRKLKAGGMSNEKIGIRYGMSRQAVGQFLNNDARKKDDKRAAASG